MKNWILPIVFLAVSGAVSAAPFTIQDPFPGTSCSDGSCDVVGPLGSFDINFGTFNVTSTGATFRLVFNYGSGSTLAPFASVSQNPTGNLYVGDLLLSVNGGAGYQYGVALNSRNAGAPNPGAANATAATAGTLYAINGILTSNQVMGGLNSVYRQNTPVWFTTLGTVISVGSVAVDSTQPNPGGADFDVTIAFSWGPNLTTDQQALVDAFTNGAFGVSFSSATCGNDILTGVNEPSEEDVPEPVTVMLTGAGLVGLGLLRRRVRQA